MNKMTNDFHDAVAIENFATVLGYESLEEIPHYDTINNFFKRLEVVELKKLEII